MGLVASSQPSVFRQLLLGSAARAAYMATTIIVAFLLTPYLIDALGLRLYGLVVLLGVFTVQGYGSLADLGLASAVVKYTAEFTAKDDHEGLTRLLGTSFWLYAGLGCGTGLLVLVVGGLAVDHLFRVAPQDQALAHTLLIVLAITTLVDFVGVWLGAVLDGLQRFGLTNLVQLARTILYVALVVVAIEGGYGALGWVTATAVANLMSYLVLYLWVSRRTSWSFSRATFDRKLVATIWAFSSKVFVTRVTGVIYNNIDRTALGLFRPTSALSVYDIANKVHRIALVPMSVTVTFVVASASKLRAQGREGDLRELFLRGTLYTAALSVPLAVILLILTPQVLRVWLGEEFVRYALECRLFLSYLLFWSLPQIGWNMMIGLNRTERILPINVASVGINLLLSLALVNRLGVLGVIAGTVAGNLIAAPWYVVVFARELRVSMREFFVRVVLRTYPLALVLAGMLWALTRISEVRSLLGVIALILIAYLVYAVLFWITSVDAVDRRRLASALNSYLGRNPVL